MAATGDYASPPPATFSRSSSLSLNRSPDTASPIYPDRAIRPLPKSRLKSKLSPEQASSIVYPPDPPPISPTLHFSLPDGANGGVHRAINGEAAYGQYLHHRASLYNELEHNHCTCNHDADSGDDEVEFDHPDYRYATSPYGLNGSAGSVHIADSTQRRQLPPIKSGGAGSAASSADGYESFENTSNKKKRKIPLAVASSMHQSQLSSDMANMGISGGSADGGADDVHGGAAGGATQHVNRSSVYGPGNGATGISGPGRGRYGRQNGRSDHGVRRPLASSNMNIHSYNSRVPPKHPAELKGSLDSGIENTQTRIISQAIKTAAEQGSLTAQTGQENSLLSAAANPSTPANSKTQFTFAVESASANKLIDQQIGAYGAPIPRTRGIGSGSVTVPGRSAQMSAHAAAVPHGGDPSMGVNSSAAANRAPHQGPHGNMQQSNAPAPAPAPKPKLRRSPSKEYALAARQRKLQQEYTNYHHRPSKENMWICEFCEYEDIFGTPPRALIRQYEIKDRAERKRIAEKRRLLEKARAKGRKNKKGPKGNKNGNTHGASAPAPAAHNANYDPNPPPEGDEYYEDDYGPDEYDPTGPDGDYADDYTSRRHIPGGYESAGVGTSGAKSGGGGAIRSAG